MRLLKLLFKPETFGPMLAMSFASAVSVLLVIARVIWNLFLAWLPLVFALLACEQAKVGARPGWRFLGFAGAWLLFFPNSPYIFTDIVHVTKYYSHFWVDLVLVLINALTG